LLIFLLQTYQNKPHHVASVISENLATINRVLLKIDKECNILSIKGDGITLDFLTVGKFAGSVVGGMNLAYPKKWKGPYLKRDPLYKGIFYELVKAKDGVFIVPGKGAVLPNGLIVGKDFSITSITSINSMLQPGGKLYYKGKAFAIQIKFKIGDWDSPFRLGTEKIEEINSILKEFNEAMPFADNSDCDSVARNM